MVFDVGNVLLAWDPVALVQRWTPAARRQDFLNGIFWHRNWHELDRGDLDEPTANRLFAERLAHPIEEIQELILAAKVSLVPIAGGVALLDLLHQRGIQLYCLTNMASGTWEFVRRRFAFWERFLGIVVSAHVRMVKPELGIYRHLLEQFALDPAATAFLDDKPDNVAGARAAGIDGVLFESSGQARQQLLARCAP